MIKNLQERRKLIRKRQSRNLSCRRTNNVFSLSLIKDVRRTLKVVKRGKKKIDVTTVSSTAVSNEARIETPAVRKSNQL